MQQLEIGITSLQPGWKRILEQEGIAFKKCDFAKVLLPKSFACIIVNSALNKNQVKNAKQFLQQGGAILTPYKLAKPLLPELEFDEKHIKFIEPEGKFFAGSGLLWLNQKAAFFRKNNKATPFEKKIGKGTLIVLPFDPEKAILETGFEKRGFFSKKAFPADFASLVSKRNIRTVITNCIRRLFTLRKLPFPHLWYYPKNYQSVFCFHIDVDNFSTDVYSTIELVKKFGLKPLWFLNMASAQKPEEQGIAPALLKQKFISQHAFEHRYYNNSEESYRNVVKGHLSLKRLGINARSISVPNGVWGKGVAKACKQLNYNFAMAFSLDSDNLPFRPILNGKELPFLLLPSHQICIGILKQYDFTEHEMSEYFSEVIERNLSANIPILLYGHPLKRMARFPKATETISKKVNSLPGLWKTTHDEYVSWWKAREKISFTATLDKGTLKISAKGKTENASIAIESANKRWLVPASKKNTRLSFLNRGTKLPVHPIADTVPKPSAFGKKYLAKKLVGNLLGHMKRLRA